MATYDLTQSIPSRIAAGDILNCPYSGAYITMTLPKGTYQLQVWGAQGGSGYSTSVASGASLSGGKGGYSIGTISLNTQTIIYLYAGGKGTSSSSATYHSQKDGGFNGGGNCPSDTNSQTYSCGGGGGASDIRVGVTAYAYRVIVAGGGGGGGAYDGNAGVGGGSSGTAGLGTSSSVANAAGGTQTSGGSCTGSYSGTSGQAGGFGTGGTGGTASGKTSGAGGGGGWYGGAGGFCGNNAYAKAGGGGSGYIHDGTNSASSLGSEYILSNASTSAGNTSFPSTSGSTETGHEGDGYVRITVISVDAGLPFRMKQNGEWKEATSGFVKVSGEWKEIIKICYKVNGEWEGVEKNYVDLGLPSGLLWAKGNIISDGNSGYKVGEETDYGAYASWGNVVPHFSSNGSTFDDSYNFGSSNTGSPYKDTIGASITFVTDDKKAAYDVSDTYDAARNLLGSSWRMPTAEEFKELYDNTDREWSTINGVSGWKMMKKSDHSVYVFFPTGGRSSSTSLINRGSNGYYWSSSLSSSTYGYNFFFTSSSITSNNTNSRYMGCSVRAVMLPT